MPAPLNSSRVERLRCSACYKEAACNCGVMPVSAVEAAKLAIERNPAMSNRALADMTGINRGAFDRARRQLPQSVAVERRTGRDGRSRRTETPRLNRARDAVREAVQNNRPVNARRVAAQTGISHVTVETAVAAERAAQEVRAEIENPANLSASSRERFDRAVAAMKRQLERERQSLIDAEVRRLINEQILPLHAERQARADRIIAAARDGIFSNSEYRLILSSLNPGTRLGVSDERLAKAFNLVKENEFLLSKRERETRTPPGAAFPTSYEELMRRGQGVQTNDGARATRR